MRQNLFILVYGLHVYPVSAIIDLHHVPLAARLLFVMWNIFLYWFNRPGISTVCSITTAHKIVNNFCETFSIRHHEKNSTALLIFFLTIFYHHTHCLFNTDKT